MKLTTMCWKSHDRIIEVACLGKIPLFCDFFVPFVEASSLKSPSLPESTLGDPDTTIALSLPSSDCANASSECGSV